MARWVRTGKGFILAPLQGTIKAYPYPTAILAVFMPEIGAGTIVASGFYGSTDRGGHFFHNDRFHYKLSNPQGLSPLFRDQFAKAGTENDGDVGLYAD